MQDQNENTCIKNIAYLLAQVGEESYVKGFDGEIKREDFVNSRNLFKFLYGDELSSNHPINSIGEQLKLDIFLKCTEMEAEELLKNMLNEYKYHFCAQSGINEEDMMFDYLKIKQSIPDYFLNIKLYADIVTSSNTAEINNIISDMTFFLAIIVFDNFTYVGDYEKNKKITEKTVNMAKTSLFYILLKAITNMMVKLYSDFDQYLDRCRLIGILNEVAKKKPTQSQPQNDPKEVKPKDDEKTEEKKEEEIHKMEFEEEEDKKGPPSKPKMDDLPELSTIPETPLPSIFSIIKAKFHRKKK